MKIWETNIPFYTFILSDFSSLLSHGERRERERDWICKLDRSNADHREKMKEWVEGETAYWSCCVNENHDSICEAVAVNLVFLSFPISFAKKSFSVNMRVFASRNLFPFTISLYF